MAKQRTFTPKFKVEVVIEALCGQTSQAELCRKHNISDAQLSKWKRHLITLTFAGAIRSRLGMLH